jgi:NTP pyrophosphatase (non-canonical NTP hydrolase)
MNKKLELGLLSLELDRSTIIDSVNINKMNWQLEKTNEELIELADAINHYKRNDAAPEQVCMELGDCLIQLAIMVELFGAQNVQLFINKKMTGIKNRNARIKNKKTPGF